MSNILIIGYGKVGSHLYHAIKASGLMHNISIHKNSSKPVNTKLIESSDAIIICTQDDKIPGAVKMIKDSGAELKGKIIVHTSGTYSSDELKSLEKAGRASFHPVQTFEKKAAGITERFKNIYIAVEGTVEARSFLTDIAKALKAKPFIIEKKFKTLHHICCVISSNFLVTHMAQIEKIYRQKNGFKKQQFLNIYMPLIFQTLSNISHSGIKSSLTGPIARNDVKTVAGHIKTLSRLNDKEIVDYYKFISKLTVGIAAKTKTVSKKQFQQLTKIKN